jgi:hypothetical protein
MAEWPVCPHGASKSKQIYLNHSKGLWPGWFHGGRHWDVAQLVEHAAVNRAVAGSSPVFPAILKTKHDRRRNRRAPRPIIRQRD